ncbi:MAG: Ferredoxin-6 [Hyphomicrobiaceae bacterium hypho_1]
MVRITFVNSDGSKKTVEGRIGSTVMETAKLNSIDGIDAECGGACACATCHVYVSEQWVDKVGNPSEIEEDMLDYASNILDNSRLSCQIKITGELDGLVVQIPDKQS